MGSKSRIVKDILPIILRGRKEGQWYIEPFCGGFNVICEVSGNRIANDINPYLVACGEALSKGWLPDKNITEETYKDIKANIDKYDKKLVGYVGFQLSFGAMWFSSYRKDSIGKRNYSVEAYNHVKKQAEKLKGIKFYNLNYSDLVIPEKSIIYCDPPYQNTSEYKANKDKIDYDRFWDWCRDKTKEGHNIYISEYSAPDDFECIWSREIYSSLSQNTGAKKATEKLFKHKEGKSTDYDFLDNF